MGDLKLWRRHLEGCTFRSRTETECDCPIWCDGRIDGRRIRHAMGTQSWDRAKRKLARELEPGAPVQGVKVKDAIGDYLEDCGIRGLSASTVASYRKTLDHFQKFCSHEAYPTLQNLTLDGLTAFRMARTGRKEKLAKASTLRKEIGCLRAFCAFAVDRGWMERNLARKLKPPKESSSPTLPFEPAEIEKILEACDQIGNREHANIHAARLRMKAFVLLLLYSGLRISDAAALARKRLNVKTGHLYLRQMKTGAPLSIKLPDDLLAKLEALPGKEYFFRSGAGKLSTVVGNLRSTLASVFEVAGVKGHPHRFRDTFAVQLLEQDVPIRTVSLLLGHTSIRTTEKHYAHFVRSQQRLLDEAVGKLDFSFPLPKLPLKNVVRNAKRDVRSRSA
jgi:site-specific recombinase XerD